MTVRTKFYLVALALILVACTTANNDDESLGLEGEDEVSQELSEAELGEDGVDAAETEFNQTETAANEPSVDPDLAEEVFNDESLGETQSQAAPVPAPAPEPQVDPVSEPPAATEIATAVDITNIRYLAEQGGRVVVDTTAPATYRTREVPNQNQLVIEIANARLPEKLKRPYITKDFRQPIASINAYQDPGSSTARLVVQFREATSADVSQQGGQLVVTASGTSSGEDAVAEAPEDQAPRDGLDTQRYFGKAINIEVRETNIRDVFNLIAEQSGANIVVSDDVKGSVTLKLRQIPWDQALMIIMKTKNLGYVRQGSVLRIAPVEQLQKETDDLRKIEDAQKLAQPLRVKVIPVSYAKVTDLATQVKDFLSSRGKVVADARTSSLIITDISENLDRTTNLIRALDTPPRQVLIEGRIIEASDSLARNLGVQWGLTGDTFYKRGASIQPQLNVTPASTASNGLSFSVTAGTLKYLGDLSATLGLAEEKSEAKILSSPRVVALNNEAAIIRQVTQIPLEKETPIGNEVQKTIEYKPIELLLDVTPQITAKSDVLLTINLKREFRNSATSAEIETREAKTKIMVQSGHTAVIGGIYQNDNVKTDKGVPLLQDVPVVGWLFKNRSTQNSKRELLLFLTPRILTKNRATTEGSDIE